MLEFITSLTAGHAALIISMLAVIASVRANSIAEKSRRLSEKAYQSAERIRVYEKRTEILSEIDTQHARFGTLLNVIASQMLLIRNNPHLFEKCPNEFNRLTQNFSAIDLLRSRYEEQRSISEQVGGGADLVMLEQALVEIRRLSIHIDEDIKKEEEGLAELKRLCAQEAYRRAED